MREFDETSRTSGPGVVSDGPPGAPTILVIDPAGEAVHDGIPATWRPLAENLRIVWLRVPAAPTWKSTVDMVLTRHRDDTENVLDVVASGPIAADVLDLVAAHPNLVRSVLLIDPEVPVEATFAQVIHHTNDVEAPLPLGHPDVVQGVLAALERHRTT